MEAPHIHEFIARNVHRSTQNGALIGEKRGGFSNEVAEEVGYKGDLATQLAGAAAVRRAIDASAGPYLAKNVVLPVAPDEATVQPTRGLSAKEQEDNYRKHLAKHIEITSNSRRETNYG